MSSLLSEEMQVRKQCEVYEDLSLFIQIFKKTIAHMEATAINIHKGNQYSYLLDAVRNYANSIHPIWEKYSKDTQPLPIDPMTFQRFVCRLAQPINLHKIKYQNITNTHSITCFITCLKQIESVIKKYQQERQFARIIQLAQIIIVKFCINCEGNIKIGSEKSNHSTIGESMKKIWPKSKSKISYEHQIQSVSSEGQESKKKVVQVKKQKIPMVSQTLQDIQKRYDSLKCIDIDFSFFKTSYFEAKNSDGNYYKDYIDRNSLTLKAITTYHDDFELFLRRKELRNYRKNKRFNETSKIKDHSIHQIPKLQKQVDRKQTIKAIKNKVSQTFDEASLKEKIINQIKEKDDLFATGFDQNKITYKMNNVYLTLGKKNVKQPSKNNLSPTMLRKKILQTQSNNHSYTETAQNEKYSTLYLQNKFKNTSDQKLVHRLKTELQKAPQEQDSNRKTIEQKIIGFVSSPIKKTIKGKYLQINCVSESKAKTQSALLKEVHKSKIEQQCTKLVMKLKQV